MGSKYDLIEKKVHELRKIEGVQDITILNISGDNIELQFFYSVSNSISEQDFKVNLYRETRKAFRNKKIGLAFNHEWQTELDCTMFEHEDLRIKMLETKVGNMAELLKIKSKMKVLKAEIDAELR